MNKNELQKAYQEIVLKTNGGVNDYVVALCRIGSAISELDDQQQQIADLQHKLKVAERTTKLACDELRNLNYKTFDNTDIDFEQHFKEQAEKEIKGK